MAFRFYMSIKGKTQGQFKPESKRAGRNDKWMECIAIDMGSAVPVDPNSGAPKGFRQHQPLKVTKEWGAASPQILQAHWRNEKLDEVVIETIGRDPGGKKEVVLERITLKGATAVGVRRFSDKPATTAVEHDVDHLEDISFSFQEILVENPEAGTSTSDNWHAVDQG
jgi:type VI secretion system Hcp family effector